MEDLFEIYAYGGMSSEEFDDIILYESLIPRGDSYLRSSKYERIDFSKLTDKECLSYFRFTKEDLVKLVPALGLPSTIVHVNSYETTGIEGLAILLRRLAYPNRLSDLEPLFGLSAPYLSLICNSVMKIIIEKKGHLLQNLSNLEWLDENRLKYYANAIKQKGAPHSNCWGFIDGTDRPICRPSVAQEEYYSGHKRVHCLKYLGVLCPDGIITALVGPYPGRRHDSGVLRESNFYAQLEARTTFGRQKYCLFGDSGFPITELIMCPYPSNNLNSQQSEFNRRMSSLHQAVEWGFGKTIADFAFLDYKKNQKLLLQEVAQMYTCATILTNCHSCLYGSQTADYFLTTAPSLDQYLQ